VTPKNPGGPHRGPDPPPPTFFQGVLKGPDFFPRVSGTQTPFYHPSKGFLFVMDTSRVFAKELSLTNCLGGGNLKGLSRGTTVLGGGGKAVTEGIRFSNGVFPREKCFLPIGGAARVCYPPPGRGGEGNGGGAAGAPGGGRAPQGGGKRGWGPRATGNGGEAGALIFSMPPFGFRNEPGARLFESPRPRNPGRKKGAPSLPRPFAFSPFLGATNRELAGRGKSRFFRGRPTLLLSGSSPPRGPRREGPAPTPRLDENPQAGGGGGGLEAPPKRMDHHTTPRKHLPAHTPGDGRGAPGKNPKRGGPRAGGALFPGPTGQGGGRGGARGAGRNGCTSTGPRPPPAEKPPKGGPRSPPIRAAGPAARAGNPARPRPAGGAQKLRPTGPKSLGRKKKRFKAAGGGNTFSKGGGRPRNKGSGPRGARIFPKV